MGKGRPPGIKPKTKAPQTEDVPPRPAGETRFTDARGEWIATLASAECGYHRLTVQRWARTGKITRRRLPCERAPFWREYVSADELAAKARVRRDAKVEKTIGSKTADPYWSNAAEAWDKYRVSHDTLTRHSKSLIRNDLRKKEPRPHPYLGHLFDTKVRDFNNGYQTLHEQVWRNEHLKKYVDAKKAQHQPLPPKMMLAVKAAHELGWSEKGMLQWCRLGKVKAEKAVGSKRDGNPANVWYVDFDSARKRAQGTIRPGDSRIVKVGGEDYLPLLEASARAGVHWRYLVRFRNVSSPKWGGIVVKATQEDLKLFRSKWAQKVWVYRANDLDAVRRQVEGINVAPAAPAVSAMAPSAVDPDDLFPADHFSTKFGIPAARLKMAAIRLRRAGYPPLTARSLAIIEMLMELRHALDEYRCRIPRGEEDGVAERQAFDGITLAIKKNWAVARRYILAEAAQAKSRRKRREVSQSAVRTSRQQWSEAAAEAMAGLDDATLKVLDESAAMLRDESAPAAPEPKARRSTPRRKVIHRPQ